MSSTLGFSTATRRVLAGTGIALEVVTIVLAFALLFWYLALCGRRHATGGGSSELEMDEVADGPPQRDLVLLAQH
jgi:hypothetical protein